jgi:hypothetical protein
MGHKEFSILAIQMTYALTVMSSAAFAQDQQQWKEHIDAAVMEW